MNQDDEYLTTPNRQRLNCPELSSAGATGSAEARIQEDDLTDFERICWCFVRWGLAAQVTTPPLSEWLNDPMSPYTRSEPLWAFWTIPAAHNAPPSAIGSHGELRWMRHTPYILEWRRDPLDDIADEIVALRKLDTFCAGLVMALARIDTVRSK